MPSNFEMAIEPHGENAQNPLHYRRKAFLVAGLDDEVEMIPHKAEILEAESVFSLRFFEDSEEKLLHLVGLENELPRLARANT
jgi:hypothetical protein